MGDYPVGHKIVSSFHFYIVNLLGRKLFNLTYFLPLKLVILAHNGNFITNVKVNNFNPAGRIDMILPLC